MIAKQFIIVGVQRPGRRKHDGGIKITDDAADSACGINTRLCAPRAGLQRQQHVRHLDKQTSVTEHCESYTMGHWH